MSSTSKELVGLFFKSSDNITDQINTIDKEINTSKKNKDNSERNIIEQEERIGLFQTTVSQLLLQETSFGDFLVETDEDELSHKTIIQGFSQIISQNNSDISDIDVKSILLEEARAQLVDKLLLYFKSQKEDELANELELYLTKEDNSKSLQHIKVYVRDNYMNIVNSSDFKLVSEAIDRQRFIDSIERSSNIKLFTREVGLKVIEDALDLALQNKEFPEGLQDQCGEDGCYSIFVDLIYAYFFESINNYRNQIFALTECINFTKSRINDQNNNIEQLENNKKKLLEELQFKNATFLNQVTRIINAFISVKNP
jgi:hypothetical protein